MSGGIAYHVGGPHGEGLRDDPRVRRVIDRESGAVQRVMYDLDGDFRIDRWSELEGERVVRTAYDLDDDGQIDHWEYFRHDGSTRRVDADTDGNGQTDVRLLFDNAGALTSVIRIDAAQPVREDTP